MMRTYLSVDRPQYADVNSLPLRHALLQTAAYVISCQKIRGEDASSPRFAVMAYYAAFLDRIPLARRDNSSPDICGRTPSSRFCEVRRGCRRPVH